VSDERLSWNLNIVVGKENQRVANFFQRPIQRHAFVRRLTVAIRKALLARKLGDDRIESRAGTVFNDDHSSVLIRLVAGGQRPQRPPQNGRLSAGGDQHNEGRVHLYAAARWGRNSRPCSTDHSPLVSSSRKFIWSGPLGRPLGDRTIFAAWESIRPKIDSS